MATKKPVSRVSALHRHNGKAFKVRRGHELPEDMPKALVDKLVKGGFTMEAKSDEKASN